MARPSAGSAFSGLTIEGSLLAPAILKLVADRKATDQSDNDYDLPRGVTLRDELSRYFRIGQATFRHLNASSSPSLESTIRFTSDLLTQVLGFPATVPGGNQEVDGRLFPVSLQALEGRAPILVVPPAETLDASSIHLRPDGRRRSAATALQDWLNVSDAANWGLCTNGIQLRLLRDNPSLTRPAYLEFDLRHIFDNEDFASFTMLWLLLHRSRFGRPDTPASDCALERCRDAGAKTGEVALLHLSGNVKEALLALANGFLEHPDNAELRQRLASGALALSAATGNDHSFFSQLLRLVYRLIFLLAAEDRDLLHLPDTPSQLRELYATGYSVGSLRDRAVLRAAHSGLEDTFGDRWQGLLLTFHSLAHGEPRLGLPALGGLFSSNQTPDIDNLALSNRALFRAMYSLAWLREGTAPVRVNWRDMQTEELGSVYEGLLELTPRLADTGRAITFAEGLETKGNERKTSGSYYTPDSLVQTLLDSALDPVLDRLEAESTTSPNGDPAAHLLTVTVLDPACGSGHFLLAAARRIATRVARLRTDGVPSAADYRHALRDVVRLCIHGVDRNPMAVELSRVALWIETVEPGKPLGFLDANLRCGDSLLGIFSLDALTQGIPEAAYKPLAGDDKAVAKVFAARNKEDLKGQGRLGLFGGPTTLAIPPALASEALALRSLPEDSEGDIAQREEAFRRVRTNPELTRYDLAADLYTAAFLLPKVKPAPGKEPNPEFPGMPLVPVSSHVWRVLQGGQVLGHLVGAARQAASFARAFHWPLEFPHILVNQNEGLRGFDVVLGNPPWEVMQLDEEEYFMQRSPEIAVLSGAKRKNAVVQLKQDQPAVYSAYLTDLHVFEAMNEYARSSGRFDLTAKGKVNTYSLFAELFARLYSEIGRAGFIAPTGIATDSTSSAFFSYLISNWKLVSLYSFENETFIFPTVHHSFRFCLVTLASKCDDDPEFAFFLRDPQQIKNKDRKFTLGSEQIFAINPNTGSSPVFRSRRDALLTAHIYQGCPVLRGNSSQSNESWGLEFRQGLFNKTADGALLHDAWDVDKSTSDDLLLESTGGSQAWLPVLEGSQAFIFDHRYATFEHGEWTLVLSGRKTDPRYEVTTALFMKKEDFADRLVQKDMRNAGYWVAVRRITLSSNERTIIAAVLPGQPATYGWLIAKQPCGAEAAMLCANMNSLVADYCMRAKLSQPGIPLDTLYQIAILPPVRYRDDARAFIVHRVLELTYTSYTITPFARDLGYEGEPFPWDEDRRALLRAELDAWYARAYGLSRDDLRYILDPKAVMGPDYPSETFRVLQNNEVKHFGYYRTERLVLAAWDRQAAGDIPASELNRLPPIITSSAIFQPTNYVELPNDAWANLGLHPDLNADAYGMLAALFRALRGPTPKNEVGLAYRFALAPKKLIPHLNEADRATWRRLVGQEAEPGPENVVEMTAKVDAPFGQALRTLRAQRAFVDNLESGTWAPGDPVEGLDLTGWLEGRARFALNAVRAVGVENLLGTLQAEEITWMEQKLA